MIEIKPFVESDWPEIRRIYQEGIDTNQATFETKAPEWADFDASHLSICRLKGIQKGQIVGWAALSPVSSRAVYAGVAEFSIYVSVPMRGLGIGSILMEKVVELSEANGIWTLHASTFPENTESLRLQEKFGFRMVGRRERIAKHHGVWRDTVITERRSKLIGTD